MRQSLFYETPSDFRDNDSSFILHFIGGVFCLRKNVMYNIYTPLHFYVGMNESDANERMITNP